MDWVLDLLLFYLIYLVSFFPRTSTAWDQAPQWGKKAKKISERARKIGQRSDPPSVSPSPPLSPLRSPIFLFHPVFCLPPPPPPPPQYGAWFRLKQARKAFKMPKLNVFVA